MIKMDKIEFYITNVCNFNCSQCNRLNNYKFNGFQKWEEYEEVYTQWSQKIDFNKINILGGEPTLNPTFKQWCVGIRKLWPNAQISVVTNGTRFDYIKDFYNFSVSNQIIWDINCHNRDRYLPMYDYIRGRMTQPIEVEFKGNFDNWINVYNEVKGADWPECNSVKEFDSLPSFVKQECLEREIDPESYLFNTNGLILKDANGFIAEIGYSEHFVTSPLKYAGNNIFEVYNSVPEEAHEVCISKYCHHFIKGKMYKCHHVALLPEFIEQYNVNISKQDIELLNQYIPAEIDWDDSKLVEFCENLHKHLDQCKLCPSKLEEFLFYATEEKPKVKKIN